MDTNRLPKQALQYKQMWLQHDKGWTQTHNKNKHYNINKCV